jgi:excisionase family DNA binding protein
MDRLEKALFVTIPEAARRAGIGRRQLRRAVARGELPVFDLGGWPRVRWSDVERWFASRRRPVREGAR